MKRSDEGENRRGDYLRSVAGERSAATPSRPPTNFEIPERSSQQAIEASLAVKMGSGSSKPSDTPSTHVWERYYLCQMP